MDSDRQIPAGKRQSALKRISPRLTGTEQFLGGSSTRDKVYGWLRERIITGRLPFGAVLSPRRLGEEVGTSFLPVSDALQRLESEGLVESRDRVGTRVRVPTVEDIQGVYVVREALESQAARLCCERATKEQRRKLWEMAREVDIRYSTSDSAEGSREAWLDANTFHMQFHRAIAVAAHCLKLQEEIERSQVLTIKIQYDNALQRKARPKNWHRNLIRGILQPDPAIADSSARLHIRYGMEETLEIVRRLQTNDRWRT